MTLSQADIDAMMGGGATTATAPPAAPAPVSRGRASPKLKRILKLSVPLSVTIAQRDMSVTSILALTVGSIIEFDVPFDADLILHVADHPVGLGQAVKVGENFGMRITSLGTVRERVDAMGGG